MAISGVGTFHSTSGTAITTKSVTTTNAGDLIAFYTLIAGSPTVTALSGGTADAGGWTKRVEFVGSNGDTFGIWTARVGTPGTADVTVTWSGSVAGLFIGFGDKQWTAGLGAGTVWALDGTASGQNNAAATTCAYPTKVPAGSGRLYCGYGVGHSAALVAGGTSGYTYHVDVIDNCFAWNPNVSASTSPTTGVTGSQTSSAIGMLFTASAPAGSGPPQFRRQAGSRARWARTRRGRFLTVVAPPPPPGPGPVPPVLYRRARPRFLPRVRARFARVTPQPTLLLCQDLNGAINGLVEYAGAVSVVAHAGVVSQGLSYAGEVSGVSYAGEVSICGR